jgi:peptide chain release factor subunit 1
MITRQQIAELLEFRNGDALVTSCYLDLDRSHMTPLAMKIRIKDLLQAAHQDLAGKAASHTQRESLRVDFERIENFVMQEIPVTQHRALAIFSCSSGNFWQTYRLPRMVRNLLIADHQPYVRPLTAIMAGHHRYCTVVLDREHARIFEVYMGQIMEHFQSSGQLPRRVREGGLGGRDERRIERRHQHALHEHLHQLAGTVFDLFKRIHFNSLICGGQRDVLREFKHHLHPYLKERWVADFHCEPAAVTPSEVLRHTMEIEEAVETEQEKRMAEQLIRKAEAGDLAVSGISATLNALHRGEAQVLLVEDGFEAPGYVCRDCRFTTIQDGPCPVCDKPVEPCPDIVDEAVTLAMQKNCQVEHVHPATPLHDAGRMGALLRYRS